MDRLITIGLIISAIYTVYAVLTPNHLFIG